VVPGAARAYLFCVLIVFEIYVRPDFDEARFLGE